MKIITLITSLLAILTVNIIHPMKHFTSPESNVFFESFISAKTPVKEELSEDPFMKHFTSPESNVCFESFTSANTSLEEFLFEDFLWTTPIAPAEAPRTSPSHIVVPKNNQTNSSRNRSLESFTSANTPLEDLFEDLLWTNHVAPEEVPQTSPTRTTIMLKKNQTSSPKKRSADSLEFTFVPQPNKYYVPLSAATTTMESDLIWEPSWVQPVASKKTKIVAMSAAKEVYNRFPCTYKGCNTSFTINDYLTKHIKTMHAKQNPHPCTICNKSFTWKTDLTKHIKTMHAKKKLHPCTLCNKSFTWKTDLTRHIRSHTEEKPYTCRFCNKSFTQDSALTIHVRKHTGEKPYTCRFCNKSFTQSGNLSRHVRKHTGEKPYICKFCDKSFTQDIDLTEHIRTHTEEKPYACKFCDKSFSNNNNLTVHVRIHTEEKPYACVRCDKIFSDPSNLNRHWLKHT